MVHRTTVITTQSGTEERYRNALISVVIQLVVGLVGLAVSLRVYLYTTNIKAGAFWPHAVLALAALLFLLGLYFKHQGRGWMVAGMVFNMLGLILGFIGIILDAVQAGHIAETDFSQCSYSAAAATAECVGSNSQSSCSLQFVEHTCYCCYLYREHHCDTFGVSLSTRPDRYEGVSCAQVQGEYQALLWTSMGFNIFAFVVAVVAFAFVANYRNSLLNVQQVPMSMMMTQSLGDSYDGRVGHGQGPVVIFSQQQAVGYYPMGLPYPVAPPDYNTAMSTAAPPVVPGCAHRSPGIPVGMTPVESNTSFSAPYGDDEPPPYAP